MSLLSPYTFRSRVQASKARAHHDVCMFQPLKRVQSEDSLVSNACIKEYGMIMQTYRLGICLKEANLWTICLAEKEFTFAQKLFISLTETTLVRYNRGMSPIKSTVSISKHIKCPLSQVGHKYANALPLSSRCNVAIAYLWCKIYKRRSRLNWWWITPFAINCIALVFYYDANNGLHSTLGRYTFLLRPYYNIIRFEIESDLNIETMSICMGLDCFHAMLFSDVYYYPWRNRQRGKIFPICVCSCLFAVLTLLFSRITQPQCGRMWVQEI